ncbi:hypothetical protein FD754_009220, partial [Muntiacus muntjak]
SILIPKPLICFLVLSQVLPFPSQVVYNRVGKCGSRTVVLLLRILSEKHGFNLVTSDIHNKTRLTKNEQMELIKNISTAEQPYLFTRHVHFLNFSRFGGDQPVYINIIRDPVNRFLSNYFFRRFGDWRGEQNHMIRTPSMRQEERYLVNHSDPNIFSNDFLVVFSCFSLVLISGPGEETRWAETRDKGFLLAIQHFFNYLMLQKSILMIYFLMRTKLQQRMPKNQRFENKFYESYSSNINVGPVNRCYNFELRSKMNSSKSCPPFFFFFEVYLIISSSSHVAANGIVSFFLWLSSILLYTCITSSLSISLSMDIQVVSMFWLL